MPTFDIVLAKASPIKPRMKAAKNRKNLLVSFALTLTSSIINEAIPRMAMTGPNMLSSSFPCCGYLIFSGLVFESANISII